MLQCWADDSCLRWSLDSCEGWRGSHDLAAELHNPEVKSLEKVETGDLALCSENRLIVLAESELVPAKLVAQ